MNKKNYVKKILVAILAFGLFSTPVYGENYSEEEVLQSFTLQMDNYGDLAEFLDIDLEFYTIIDIVIIHDRVMSRSAIVPDGLMYLETIVFKLQDDTGSIISRNAHRFVVTGNNVALRSSPSIPATNPDSNRIGLMHAGNIVIWDGFTAVQSGSGHIWWNVTTATPNNIANGIRGWVSQNFIS